MTWKPSTPPDSGFCPDASVGRLLLPILSLSLQLRWGLVDGGVLGVAAADSAALVMKIWLALTEGGVGADRGKLDGLWLSGLLFLLKMLLPRDDFLWACCACWLCSCCWMISWTSSWSRTKRRTDFKTLAYLRDQKGGSVQFGGFWGFLISHSQYKARFSRWSLFWLYCSSFICHNVKNDCCVY